MDLCTYSCSGCIVIPYNIRWEWSRTAMRKIQGFLFEHGFVVRDMVSDLHQYHLADNPLLPSASIIVDRISQKDSPHCGQSLPSQYAISLYGKPRRIPHYIEIDPNAYDLAKPDYNWEYGDAKWWDDQPRLNLRSTPAIRNDSFST